MTLMQAVPADHPLMIAWEAYKTTPAFENSREWALKAGHRVENNHYVDGSLWAAFEEGFRAAGGVPQECSCCHKLKITPATIERLGGPMCAECVVKEIRTQHEMILNLGMECTRLAGKSSADPAKATATAPTSEPSDDTISIVIGGTDADP